MRVLSFIFNLASFYLEKIFIFIDPGPIRGACQESNNGQFSENTQSAFWRGAFARNI